jgi:hypothetical protein
MMYPCCLRCHQNLRRAPFSSKNLILPRLLLKVKRFENFSIDEKSYRPHFEVGFFYFYFLLLLFLVVGHMTYNPVLQKWEGNEHILKQFDTVSRNTRPALISNLGLKLPQSVGNMVFDPVQMRWIGNDEDADVFADFESPEDLKKATMTPSWSLDPEFVLSIALCDQLEESERRHHEFITKQKRCMDPISTHDTSYLFLLRPLQTPHRPHR